MNDLNTTARPDGRRPDEMRPIRWRREPAPSAAGSVWVELGHTRVLCAAMIEEGVPRWMREQRAAGGWLTAEYRMLPYATATRTPRESSLGRLEGRTLEIQRMIGRCLRAVTDLRALGARTIWVDCDVVEADGGTRTAAISGAWAALALAVRRAQAEGRLAGGVLRDSVAAVSVGLFGGEARLDLCYAEDATTDADLNIALTGSGDIVEVQGSAERKAFSYAQLDAALGLARQGAERWKQAQDAILRDAANSISSPGPA